MPNTIANRKAICDVLLERAKTDKDIVVLCSDSRGSASLTPFFDAFPEQIEFKPMGEGFTWDTQDRARDIAVTRVAWDEVKRMIADPDIAMVVADELNIVLRYEYLPFDEVVAGLLDRGAMKHVIVTGRNAPEALIEAADLVTEMVQVKHPFRSGVKAQRGIEF